MRSIFQLGARLWKPIRLLLLIAITFSYAMFQGGFVSWFLFYSFLPFSLYALYLVFVSLQSFSVQRSLSKWEYFAHDDITVTIQVKRKHTFPLLFIIVEDVLSPSMLENVIDKKNRRLIYLGFKKECSFQYEIHNLQRGEHELTSVRIMTGDILGVVEKEKRIEKKEKILVFPSFQEFVGLPVNRFLDQGKMLMGGHAHRETSTVVGIREYQPGDRFSWINWKASAKRVGMVTKEFEHRTSTDVLIVLDSMPTERFERLVSFTASLGQTLLYQRTPVGFLSVNEEPVSMPIHGGEASRRQLFYHLAKIQPNCPKPFDRVLAEEPLLMGKKAALLLVTSHLSEPLIEAAGKMAAQKRPVLLFVIESEQDSVTSKQESLKVIAKSYGILVIFIHEGQYSTGLMEVN